MNMANAAWNLFRLGRAVDQLEQQVATQQAQLRQSYLGVRVATHAAYVAECAGSQKKIITIAADETDSGQTNRYFYEGDGQVHVDPIL